MRGKKNRIICSLTALFLAGLLSGCLGGLYPEPPEVSEETRAAQEAEAAARDEELYKEGHEVPDTGNVWQYYYTGIDHPYLTAISDYLSRYDMTLFERADGMIPCITIAEIDNSDQNDIKIWGIFDINNYNQEGTTLVAESGVRLIGRLHLQKLEDGSFQVTSAELTGDYDDAVIQEICEGHEQAYEVLQTRYEPRETRTWYISEWVREYGLSADRYRYYDYTDVLYDAGEEEAPEWFSILPSPDSL